MDLDRGFLTTLDSRNIAYKHYRDNNSKVIVVAHGFYNSKDSELLGELGDNLSGRYDVLMFDFRGHGKSSGVFTWSSREDKDLAAVLDFLKDKYEKTAVVGFSLGAMTCVNVLSKGKYKVDSYVSVSAPSDFDKIDYKWWQLDWENDIFYSLLTKKGRRGKGVRPGAWWLNKPKPIDNIGKLSMPVLYIHGDSDWVVGKWHSEKLYEKTRTQKDIVIVKNGPHAEYLLRKHKNEVYGKISEWLKTTL